MDRLAGFKLTAEVGFMALDSVPAAKRFAKDLAAFLLGRAILAGEVTDDSSDKRAIAAHEAGHATVALSLGFPVLAAKLLPSSDTGFCRFGEEPEPPFPVTSPPALMRVASVVAAGFVAEQELQAFTGQTQSAAYHEIATTMVYAMAIGRRLGLPAQTILRTILNTSYHLIRDNFTTALELQHRLLSDGAIDGNELQRLAGELTGGAGHPNAWAQLAKAGGGDPWPELERTLDFAGIVSSAAGDAWKPPSPRPVAPDNLARANRPTVSPPATLLPARPISIPDLVEAALRRHDRVGFQFSGGKDSTACLYLLWPYLDRITVYHLNTSDQPPETTAVVNHCRKHIPHFVEIRTDSRAWVAQHGFPSDVVPTFSTPMGRITGFGNLPLIDRFGCCVQNIMGPMHDRIRQDGITLLIRGTRSAEMPTVPVKSGEVAEGIEVLNLIEGWSDEAVMDFLRQVGAPVSSVYDHINDSPDCMHCTAWWDDKSIVWLRQAHPEVADWVGHKHIEIKKAVTTQMNHLEDEKSPSRSQPHPHQEPINA